MPSIALVRSRSRLSESCDKYVAERSNEFGGAILTVILFPALARFFLRERT